MAFWPLILLLLSMTTPPLVNCEKNTGLEQKRLLKQLKEIVLETREELRLLSSKFDGLHDKIESLDEKCDGGRDNDDDQDDYDDFKERVDEEEGRYEPEPEPDEEDDYVYEDYKEDREDYEPCETDFLEGTIYDPAYSIDHGDTVYMECEEGYHLQGPGSGVCEDGTIDWDKESKCEGDPCTVPLIEYGYLVDLTTNETISVNNRVSHSTKVRLACEQYYSPTLGSSPVATCELGVMDMEAACDPASCTLTPKTALIYMADGREITTKKVMHGTQVEISCESGYKNKGASALTCYYGQMESVSREPEPSCEPQRGREPQRERDPHREREEPPHGREEPQRERERERSGPIKKCTVEGEGFVMEKPGSSKPMRNGRQIYPSVSVMHSCEKGYYNSEKDNVIVMNKQTVKCTNGIWETEDAGKVYCRPFPGPCRTESLPGTIYSLPESREPADSVEHGGFLYMECEEGYRLVGSGTGICDYGNIVWDEKSRCEGEPCSVPYIEYGSLIDVASDLTLDESSRVRHGTIVKLNCEERYTARAEDAVTAMCELGQLEMIASCEPVAASCKLHQKPGLVYMTGNREIPSDEVQHGMEVSIACTRGYKRKGSATMMCAYGQLKSQTSEPDPMCLSRTQKCSIPGHEHLLRGIKSKKPLKMGRQISPGVTLRHTCRPGYHNYETGSGEKKNLQQSVKCVGGMWTVSSTAGEVYCKQISEERENEPAERQPPTREKPSRTRQPTKEQPSRPRQPTREEPTIRQPIIDERPSGRQPPTREQPSRKPTVCPPGNFGWRCKFQCQCKDGDTCDPLTGVCPEGCPPKKWGIGCSLEGDCTYNDENGENYMGTVSNTKGGSPCKPWSGYDSYPDNHLPDGTTKLAKNYCRNPIHENGRDRSADRPWCYDNTWQGWDYCSLRSCSCPPGHYGVNCTMECHCTDPNEECDQETGKCDSGCDVRWTGSDCQECAAGHFGKSCERDCRCRSRDDECDRETGKCTASA